MLRDIRFIIGIDAGQKGLPPTIIAPLLNLLELMDNDLASCGFDFVNPLIEKEYQRLKQAVVLWNSPDLPEELPELPALPAPQNDGAQVFLSAVDPIPEPSVEVQYNSDTSFLDEDDDENDDI